MTLNHRQQQQQQQHRPGRHQARNPVLGSEQDAIDIALFFMGCVIVYCCIFLALVAAYYASQTNGDGRRSSRSRHASNNHLSSSEQSTGILQEARLERIKQCLIVRYWTNLTAEEEETSTTEEGKGDATTTAVEEVDGMTKVDLEEGSSSGRLDKNHAASSSLDDDDDDEATTTDLEESAAENKYGCAICLAPFQEHEVVCESSNNSDCSHVFHLTCMLLWLRKHSSCPICRKTYLVDESSPSSSSLRSVQV